VSLKSFSLICTDSLEREARLCIYAIRKIYDIPIVVGCDPVTKTKIDSENFKDVETFPLITNENLKIYKSYNYPQPVRGSHHNSEIIAMKMDVLARAIREHGNTLFIDSDVLILKEIHHAIWWGGDCMLSPHYYGYDRQKSCENYGIYNAGYLWANTTDVADRWREIYLYRSKFLEQEGMVWLNQYFDVGHFSRGHNIGFWRMHVQQKKYTGQVIAKLELQPEYILSLHARIVDHTLANGGWVLELQEIFKEKIIRYLPTELLRYHEYLEKN
jgi:hypothetical protein